MNTVAHHEGKKSNHRLFEDSEFSKTVLVAATTVGCAVLLGLALFANIVLK